MGFELQSRGASLIVATFLGFVSCLGCGKSGPEQAVVRGRVTFRGKPVEQGTIVFFPTAGVPGRQAGAEIVNGEYSILENGPALGTHRVEIQAYRKTGRKVPDVTGDVMNPNRPMIDEIVPILPPSFNMESRLTADITSSEITKDFNL